jgi:cytoskeletal protein CcmA (bactofilin family)
MADAQAQAGGEYPTVIGQDASFKGELKFDKGVRLLGRLEGLIETKGQLDVAEGASLEGEVKAGNIRVEGAIKGNLKASGKVHLTASAKLEGDLTTARLEVAEGAVFVGRCVVGTDAKPSAPSAASAGKTEHAAGKGAPQPATVKK